MTTTTSGDVVPAQPDGTPHPAEPGIREALAAVAVAMSLKGYGEDEEKRLRQVGGAMFLDARERDGMKTAVVTVPGVGEVGVATLKEPHPLARVTNEDAYLGFVEDRYPSEIEHRVTITLNPERPGAGALVEAIRDLAADYPGMATVKEFRGVRDVFRKKHLESNVNAADLTLEDPDPATGDLTVVPGVTVTQPPATGEFSITKFTPEKKAAVRAAIARNELPLAQVLGVDVSTPAVDSGRTIPGEAVDAQ